MEKNNYNESPKLSRRAALGVFGTAVAGMLAGCWADTEWMGKINKSRTDTSQPPDSFPDFADAMPHDEPDASGNDIGSEIKQGPFIDTSQETNNDQPHEVNCDEFADCMLECQDKECAADCRDTYADHCSVEEYCKEVEKCFWDCMEETSEKSECADKCGFPCDDGKGDEKP